MNNNSPNIYSFLHANPVSITRDFRSCPQRESGSRTEEIVFLCAVRLGFKSSPLVTKMANETGEKLSKK